MNWIRRTEFKQGRAIIKGRQVYILPTRYGLIFGVLLLSLLIASINYANNPAFLLTFLSFGLMVQSIFYTWFNLQGMTVYYLGYSPVFAGETTYIRFRIESNRPHYSIQLGFKHQKKISDVPNWIELPYPTTRRGIWPLPRLVIETQYPLGLFRAWTYLDLKEKIIVWPSLLPAPLPPGQPDQIGQDQGDQGEGTDDFIAYRPYQPGDPAHHIAWKIFSAEKGLWVKQFGGSYFKPLWLDIEQVQAADQETRLSYLAYYIEQMAQQSRYYGLKLHAQIIEPHQGEWHRRHCLNALAKL